MGGRGVRGSAGRRREALAAGLGAALMARVSEGAAPAPVRAGALLDRRRAELARTRQLLEADPDSQLLAAQRYLLQNEIDRVAANSVFVSDAARGLNACMHAC